MSQPPSAIPSSMTTTTTPLPIDPSLHPPPLPPHQSPSPTLPPLSEITMDPSRVAGHSHALPSLFSRDPNNYKNVRASVNGLEAKSWNDKFTEPRWGNKAKGRDGSVSPKTPMKELEEMKQQVHSNQETGEKKEEGVATSAPQSTKLESSSSTTATSPTLPHPPHMMPPPSMFPGYPSYPNYPPQPFNPMIPGYSYPPYPCFPQPGVPFDYSTAMQQMQQIQHVQQLLSFQNKIAMAAASEENSVEVTKDNETPQYRDHKRLLPSMSFPAAKKPRLPNPLPPANPSRSSGPSPSTLSSSSSNSTITAITNPLSTLTPTQISALRTLYPALFQPPTTKLPPASTPLPGDASLIASLPPHQQAALLAQNTAALVQHNLHPRPIRLRAHQPGILPHPSLSTEIPPSDSSSTGTSSSSTLTSTYPSEPLKHIIIDLLDTILETCPFATIAARQSLPEGKVRAIFEALVQVPMLRYPEDKRKVSKFALGKLREYHEAKRRGGDLEGIVKVLGESNGRDYPAGVPNIWEA